MVQFRYKVDAITNDLRARVSRVEENEPPGMAGSIDRASDAAGITPRTWTHAAARRTAAPVGPVKRVARGTASHGADAVAQGTLDGGGAVFASPRAGNISLDQALSNPPSQRQERSASIAGSFVDRFLPGARVHAGIGASANGAEIILGLTAKSADPETLEYVAARLGRAGGQTNVLVFQSEPTGPHLLYTVLVPEKDLDLLSRRVQNRGIRFSTLVPMEQGTRVFVFDETGGLADDVIALGGEYGIDRFDFYQGTGKFVGDSNWADRDAASAEFDRIIRGWESRYPERFGAASGRPALGGANGGTPVLYPVGSAARQTKPLAAKPTPGGIVYPFPRTTQPGVSARDIAAPDETPPIRFSRIVDARTQATIDELEKLVARAQAVWRNSSPTSLDRFANVGRARIVAPTPAKRALIDQWLKGVEIQLLTARAAGHSAGLASRDLVLLDYLAGRFNGDTLTARALPPQFWLTREGQTYAAILLRNPRFANAFVKFKQRVDDARAQLPAAYRDRVRIPSFF